MARSVSPGYLLACLLAGHDLSVAMLCRRSGLSGREVTGILSGRRVITPRLAEKLGAVFHSPGFWVGRRRGTSCVRPWSRTTRLLLLMKKSASCFT